MPQEGVPYLPGEYFALTTGRRFVSQVKLDPKQVAKISEAIQKAHFRDKFVSSPEDALKEAGVEVGQLDKKFLDTLRSLSPAELEAVASVQAKTALAGLEPFSDANGYMIF